MTSTTTDGISRHVPKPLTRIDNNSCPAQTPCIMGNQMQALSREEIRAMRGRYKLDTDGKPFSQWWADRKQEEIELEERKLQRLSALGKK